MSSGISGSMCRIRPFVLAAGVGLMFSAQALTLTPETTEVVVAPKAPDTVRFAVEELTNALSRVFASPVAVATAPTAGRRHVYLGENEWTRAAGLEPRKLPRDAFEIRVTGTDVFIAGADDPKARIAAETGPSGFFEIATVHGVYEFLERYAGVRYYFPGPLGTILPKAKALKVPEGDFTSEPDYSVRYHTTYIHGTVPETILPAAEVASALALHERRMRIDTERIPCCHGQYQSKLPQRFAKTHPEYFCLKKDGTRRDTDPEKPPLSDYAHVCLTSDVWEEIYKDARSYLKGEPASVRGMLRGRAPNYKHDWPNHARYRKYYDVMPQDGSGKCVCEKCKAAIAKAKDPKDWANELVWGHTVDIAKRLKAEGIKGYITQMAYSPYKNVPDVEIPDNVKVMVAQKGPWAWPEALAEGERHIRAWGEKTGGAVWLWTYVGKYGGLRGTTDWIPCGTPRAMGRYWQGLRGLIFGGYSEDGTDRWLHHYLDTYVFAKVCWNNETDVEALLDEHDRLMFGRAAKPMGTVIRLMEKCWLRIGSNTIETPLGPLGCAPSDDEIYMRIYGPKVLAKFDELYAKAASLVRPGSLEARRIALYKREYYDVIREKAKRYQFIADVPYWRKFVEEHPELVQKGNFAVERNYPGELVVDADGRGFTMTSNPETHGVRVYRGLPNFEYGKRYRISWFVKCDNVVPDKGGCGQYAYFQCGTSFEKDSIRMPATGRLTGTFDWKHQAIEFTRAENTKDERRFSRPISFNNLGCTGSVSIRDIVVEEID